MSTVVTKLVKRTTAGGKTYYFVGLADQPDGDVAAFNKAATSASHLSVGDTVDYAIQETDDGRKNLKFIKSVSSSDKVTVPSGGTNNPSSTGNPPSGKAYEDPKDRKKMMLISYAKDLMIGKNLTEEQAFNSIVSLDIMWDKYLSTANGPAIGAKEDQRMATAVQQSRILSLANSVGIDPTSQTWANYIQRRFGKLTFSKAAELVVTLEAASAGNLAVVTEADGSLNFAKPSMDEATAKVVERF